MDLQDLVALQGLTAPQDPLVHLVNLVYLANLESLAKGARKVKVDYLVSMGYPDLLVPRGLLEGKETLDKLDLLVYLVRLDFQGN